MFKKVLIVNRGEIALRIARTIKKMGIVAVGIYEERERNSAYVQFCDEAWSLGSGDIGSTFLNIDKIISIARESNADAIHPGYGFLAENALFAERCREEKIVFIGPKPSTIQLMGSKLEALRLAREKGVPVIPGLYGSAKEIITQVNEDIFPCLVKASAGGGGKGMRLAQTKNELIDLLEKTAREAKKYFADDAVFVEKYLANPRHIEVQVLGDSFGNQIHLFERECSIQRRYQKVIEESPAVSINPKIKKKLYADALKIARSVNYQNAGTVEFLVDALGNHYFLEMNTRIQVEHPVTEAITGIDIVEQQINIASGKEIPKNLFNLKPQGHAIEVRLYAEDPLNNFRPSPGKVALAIFPKELARFDTAVQSGDTIAMDYDPLLAKIITSGNSREQALGKMRKALLETHVHGIIINRNFLLSVLNDVHFQKNRISTHYIDENLDKILDPDLTSELEPEMLLAALFLTLEYEDSDTISTHPLASRLGYWRAEKTNKLEVNGTDIHFLEVKKTSRNIAAKIHEEHYEVSFNVSQESIVVQSNRQQKPYFFSWNTDNLQLTLSSDQQTWKIFRPDWLSPQKVKGVSQAVQTNGSMQLKAPLTGQVVRINYKVGERIKAGESLMAIESMKMENEIRLPARAELKKIYVKPGIQVSEGDLLMELQVE